MSKLIPYIIYDTETTGVKWKENDVKNNSRMHELSMTKIWINSETGEIEKREEPKSMFFNDEETVKQLNEFPSAVKTKLNITEATFENLKQNGKLLKDSVQEIKDFIGDATMVGYNAIAFDRIVLNEELKRVGEEPLKNDTIDPFLFFSLVVPAWNNKNEQPQPWTNIKGATLTDVYLFIKNKTIEDIPVEKLHTAEFDTEMLTEVFLEMRKKLNNNLTNYTIKSHQKTQDIYLRPIKGCSLNEEGHPTLFHINSSIKSKDLEFKRVITLDALKNSSFWWYNKDKISFTEKGSLHIPSHAHKSFKGECCVQTHWIDKEGNLNNGNYIFSAPLASQTLVQTIAIENYYKNKNELG
ncbi:MAG: 3'-5' exonuclease [Mycoplasma sp.]